MQGDHRIVPLDESSRRQILAGWGSCLMCSALGFLLGGIYIAYVWLFAGAAIAFRGHAPRLFVKHIDAQLIAGAPYRRKESLWSWAITAVLILVLSAIASAFHKRLVPKQQDVASVVREAVAGAFRDVQRQQKLPAPNATPLPPKEYTEPIPFIEIEPFLILKRTQVKQVKIEKDDLTLTDYGLAVLLRGQNSGSEPHDIRKLEIVGDVPTDCNEYLGAFAESGQNVDEIWKDCKNRKPYQRISWVAWPLGETRIEPKGGERFVRFIVAPVIHGDGSRVYSSLPGHQPDIKGYFGFRADGTEPRILTTAPHVFDLVHFSSATVDREGRDPKLRQEVERGAITISVIVDTKRIVVPMSHMRPVALRSNTEWDEETSQDLFYGTDWQGRTMPVQKDPAMQNPGR